MSLKKLIQNWSVSKKLTVLIAGSALATGIITGISASFIASNELHNVAQHDMKQVSVEASKTLKTYLESIKQDLLASSKSTVTAQILTAFNDGWNNIATDQKTYLQNQYIKKNPNPLGQKDKMMSANDGSYYSDVHKAYHSQFLAQKDAKGYYDIFLFNAEGDVIYSVFKEADYATNMNDGKWASTDLATVFKEARDAGSPDFISFKDFAPYGPSANAPASFIAAPIYNEANEFIGAIAYQMPVDNFNAVFNMQDPKMTSYLVGTDNLLRSDNPKTEGINDILTTSAPLENISSYAGQVLENQKGLAFEEAIYAIEPLNFGGTEWYSVVEMDNNYINSKIDGLQLWTMALSILSVVLVAIGGLFATKRVSQPIGDLSETVEKIAQGYSVDIPYRDYGDEIGSLARSMTAIHQRAVESARIQTAVEEARSSMMIADIEGKVIYNNKTIANKLQDSRKYLNLHMPRIDVDDLTKSYLSDFHGENGEQINTLLQNLKEPYISELQFDNRYFDSVIRPVYDKSGNHLGFVSEWREKTGEVLAEQEKIRIRANEESIEAQISEVIQNAACGNFKSKLDIQSNDRAFIKSVSEGINQICGAVDDFFQELNSTVSSFAEGDLTKSLKGTYSGQFEEVKGNLNGSFQTLSSTIKQIATVGNGIRSASGDITQGADDLSGRTEAQAASIEETVATMEQISASVRNNANSAVQASNLAAETLTQAEEGSRVVSQAVDAMQSLENSSHRIAEIVSVIDSIASQTNLLALNAAVEAARAGEAGKGFAVVASEVRTLASRCSEAARDIRGLITGSNAQVTDGVKLVNATGSALRQIVESVNDVSQTIASISSASREQATGVEEISGAISQMDEMTQQNASLSDESASAARSLAKEAEQLAQLIRHFKTEDITSMLASVSKDMSAEKESMTQNNDFDDFGAGTGGFGIAAGDDWADL